MTQTRDHIVTTQVAQPRLIAAVHARVAMGSIPKVFGRYLDQVYAAAKAGSIHVDGQNIFLYHRTEERPDELDVAFGVGAKAPFATTGSVEPIQLPTGEVATTTHWGSYANLRAAHDAISEWCRANGRRRTGASWEVYGHWTEDESRLRTDVFYLLEPA